MRSEPITAAGQIDQALYTEVMALPSRDMKILIIGSDKRHDEYLAALVKLFAASHQIDAVMVVDTMEKAGMRRELNVLEEIASKLEQPKLADCDTTCLISARKHAPDQSLDWDRERAELIRQKPWLRRRKEKW